MFASRYRVGGETAVALLRRSWMAVAMARDPAARVANDNDPLKGATWIKGDAMRASDVHRVAGGARLIIHAVNPPGYRDWDTLVLLLALGQASTGSFATANEHRIRCRDGLKSRALLLAACR